MFVHKSYKLKTFTGITNYLLINPKQYLIQSSAVQKQKLLWCWCDLMKLLARTLATSLTFQKNSEPATQYLVRYQSCNQVLLNYVTQILNRSWHIKGFLRKDPSFDRFYLIKLVRMTTINSKCYNQTTH